MFQTHVLLVKDLLFVQLQSNLSFHFYLNIFLIYLEQNDSNVPWMNVFGSFLVLSCRLRILWSINLQYWLKRKTLNKRRLDIERIFEYFIKPYFIPQADRHFQWGSCRFILKSLLHSFSCVIVDISRSLCT